MKLTLEEVCAGYGTKIVLDKINMSIESGKIITLLGPNGSGKSTLVKIMGRIIKPWEGNVLFNGKNINSIDTKELAKKIAILPQSKHIQSDINVERLVKYGRYPHQRFGSKLTKEDMNIIDWSLKNTGMQELRYQYLNNLSGGERQRVWIAMALAQRPEILVLDEPTTYLDLAYQIEVLELIKELNEKLKITVIMVLHDINQAVRYSDMLYLLKEGKIFSFGEAESLLDKESIKEVYSVDADVYKDIRNGCPYYIINKEKSERVFKSS